jgi:cytochrome o ubiquinol oxidase subunit 2
MRQAARLVQSIRAIVDRIVAVFRTEAPIWRAFIIPCRQARVSVPRHPFASAQSARLVALIVESSDSMFRRGHALPGVLDPRGPIAAAERLILLDSMAIMSVVVVPVIVMTLAFAWWYRASNPRARYRPDWAYSGQIELTVWAIPTMVVLLLGGVGWIGSHDLDPSRPLKSAVAPLKIDAVSLDWKWLFIYPDAGVASVDELIVPEGVPLRFELTSATVMNAFFVPQLGSQIYTMPGMTTHLDLLADGTGSYPGLSSHFSGAGFSDMRFVVHSVSARDYEAWLAHTRGGGRTLDAGTYATLAQAGSRPGIQVYGQVTPRLFEQIIEWSAPTTAARPQAR